MRSFYIKARFFSFLAGFEILFRIFICVIVLKLLKPDPMVVATKLLTRRKLIDTGKQFNMIAASWIQFMIHDWVDHLEETDQVL